MAKNLKMTIIEKNINDLTLRPIGESKVYISGRRCKDDFVPFALTGIMATKHVDEPGINKTYHHTGGRVQYKLLEKGQVPLGFENENALITQLIAPWELATDDDFPLNDDKVIVRGAYAALLSKLPRALQNKNKINTNLSIVLARFLEAYIKRQMDSQQEFANATLDNLDIIYRCPMKQRMKSQKNNYILT